MLFAAALEGKTVNLTGNVDLPHTLTYIRDFASALVTLSQHDEAYGQAWHVPSAETLTTRQFMGLVEEEINQTIKIRVAGKNLIRFIGLFNPTVREIVEMMYEFEEPFVIDHSRFQAHFNNEVTPHAEAIKETVDWYRNQASAS
jgi:nucleoside-diphosphate-sugar epimerase